MSCQILQIDAQFPSADKIQRAADCLRSGGLVAFPTETVYGLGANALDQAAVAKIFAAKGRPAQNPIIVHVADIEAAKSLTTAWSPTVQKLAERFWPGPLTLVLPKAACIPDLVTAGGPTVALRIPAHPVALALLRACKLPLAAPSANRSTELSPTLPQHVLAGLADRIDLLLDAGATPGGIESSVLDMTTDPPRLLRPGLLTIAELEAVVGRIERGPLRGEAPVKSPGQQRRHYAPRTPLDVVRDCVQHVEELAEKGLGVGWLTHVKKPMVPGTIRIMLPAEPIAYSAGLYAALHQLDAAGLDRIVVEAPPDDPDWLAVLDRLHRAAAK